MTRSMYSTWKIAFDRTWAGPSWTSWASRDRSDSWASTIRIWTSVAQAAVSATRLESPRSRKTHVDFEVLQRDLELGQLGLLPPSSSPSASTSAPERRESAPRSAAILGLAEFRRRRADAGTRRRRRSLGLVVELVAERLPAARSSVYAAR
jgi:hypothetical protein